MPISALGSLLHITGVVEHQHPIRVTQLIDHIGAQVIADRVGVPHRLAQQPLHPLRAAVAGLFGQLPTRPAVHIGQQSEQERPSPPTRLHPTAPARDPRERRVELFQPRLDVYAVAVCMPADAPSTTPFIVKRLHHKPGLED